MHMAVERGLQRVARGVDPLPFAGQRVWAGGVQLPVARQPAHAIGLHAQGVRRLQLAHAAQDGTRRRHHGVQRKQVMQRDRVDRSIDATCGEQRRQARCEAQARAVLREVERLHAEAVACQQQALAAWVPQREGEHAVEPAHTVFAPLRVGLEEDLGIAAGDEAPAQLAQFSAQRAVVVDDAVEHQHAAGVGVAHGLVARLAQVDDRQSGMSERDRAAVPLIGMVRPAGLERIAHALDGGKIGRLAVEAQFTADAAHIASGA
ncbi:hypothetical protein THICB1_60006 [Thiomonas arsenitoxydans]|uniref:Uncharacterized protein n=1 Tax=Thiomonas arsenitoxydans (strain DSM 22701 / CIP 110005 / 3As) TaxID=426114 RepID=A0ABM9T7U8_THIA3|nr:hypothetical protein THICB1_60006 [Thiomonas arsenitoxydans]